MTLISTKNSWKFICFSFILFGLIYGCDDDLERSFGESIVVNSSEIIVPYKVEASVSLDFSSSTQWKATSDVNWITIEDEFKTGEEGENRIDILVEPNESEDKREGKVTISSLDGDISKTITIVQEAEEESEPEIQTLFYVKENGDGNGKSWNEAMDFQSALDRVMVEDTIYIAEGTYTPSKIITNGNSNDNRDKTFEISKNITLLGGFPSDASETSERDPSKYETNLSGELKDGGNAYHTVVVSAPLVPGKEVNIGGITIRDGASADRSSKVEINNTSHERWYGGGINIANAVVNLTNVKITENNNINGDDSSRAGGVMITDDSQVTFNKCLITKNEVSSNHGGVRIDNSTVYMFDTEISYNKSGTSAGVYTYGSSAELYMYNCVVKGNESTEYGTGLYISWGSIVYIVNSLVIDNINKDEGKKGGAALMLYKDNSTAYVISSTITGNKATYGGGVLGLSGDYSLNIYNSILSGNTSKEGAEIHEASGSFTNSFKSSVIDGKFYDGAGTEQSGTVAIDDVIDSDLFPIGSPVTDKGMSGSDLTSDDDIPAISNEEYLDIDYYSNSRTKNIMGAIVEKE